MEMIPVKFSKNVEAIGYDAGARELCVRFQGGRDYTYLDVSPEKHAQLMAASSKGSFIAQHVKPHHKVKK